MNPNSFANHLILDFFNVPKEELEKPENLSLIFTKMLESLKLSIENYSFKNIQSKACLYTYILATGHCKAHLDLTLASCNVELYLWGASSMDQLKHTEESLCTHFGWGNCVTSILLQRGGITQFFLNDTTHTGTIFKKFKFLHRERSEFHEIRVYDTEELGRALIVDGFIQFSEDKKETFTSLITKDVLKEDKHYENVLVIGAGDLILIDSLIQKHKNIKKIVVLENDEKLIQIIDKFFDFTHKYKEEMKESKLELETHNIKDFLSKDKRKFDAVFLDLCDVNKTDFYNVEFYKQLKEVVNKEVVISQKLQDISSVPDYQKKMVDNGFTWLGSEFCEVPDHNTRFTIMKAKN